MHLLRVTTSRPLRVVQPRGYYETRMSVAESGSVHGSFICCTRFLDRFTMRSSCCYCFFARGIESASTPRAIERQVICSAGASQAELSCDVSNNVRWDGILGMLFGPRQVFLLGTGNSGLTLSNMTFYRGSSK